LEEEKDEEKEEEEGSLAHITSIPDEHKCTGAIEEKKGKRRGGREGKGTCSGSMKKDPRPSTRRISSQRILHRLHTNTI